MKGSARTESTLQQDYRTRRVAEGSKAGSSSRPSAPFLIPEILWPNGIQYVASLA